MQFSVKWAAAAPAYIGMLVGAVMMARVAGSVAGAIATVPFGLFFGGAMGLPAAAANLVVALAVATTLRGQPFAIQFAAFALGSALANLALLRALHRIFGPLGGLVHDGGEQLAYAAFGAAGLGLALLLMWRWPAGAA